MANQFVDSLATGIVLRGSSYTYTIVRPLGQGSFGITYLARAVVTGALGDIDVDVAIKEFFMREINGREEATVTCNSKSNLYSKYREKFRKESRNMGAIHHRGVIRVLESFEANNTSYYVMEYIAEGSLDDYIKAKGHLSENETIELTRQIAEALGEIHSHSMVHLDLKPGNIMMAKGVRPVLIDFGLAKQFDDSGNPESSTTIGGGSPGYAPLEQSNYNRDTDRSVPVTMDIYALGATMFKMLTGRRAPDASAIFNDGFPEADLDAVGVSPALKAVVRKAMAPARKDRYPTVDVLLRALPSSDDAIALVEDTKIEEPTTSSEAVEEKANKKLCKRWLIPLISCFFAAVCVGGYLVLNHSNKEDAKKWPVSEDMYIDDPILESVRYDAQKNVWFGANGIKYLIYEDRAAVTTSYVKGNIVIPDFIEYDGIEYPVTSIEDGAFALCADLYSIYLPETLERIDIESFYNCTGLESITIPNSVTSLDKGAFVGCEGLQSFYGKYASDDGRCLIVDGTLLAFAPAGLTEYSIPEYVTRIDEYAFMNCTNLKSVIIPETVKSIGDNAFMNCTSLKSIVIPYNVHKIGDLAFAGCTNLTEVDIQNPGCFVANDAFQNTPLIIDYEEVVAAPQDSIISYPAGSIYAEDEVYYLDSLQRYEDSQLELMFPQ